MLFVFIQSVQAIPMHFDQYNNYDYWKVTPEIVLCQSQSIFSKQDVAYALALWEVEDPTRFGIVGIDEKRQITQFKEKPKPEEVFSNLINFFLLKSLCN